MPGQVAMISYVIDRAVKVLNEALEADRQTIDQIFRTEFRCNEELGDYPSIQVGPSFEPYFEAEVVRVLGLINGLFGVDDRGRGPISMTVNGRDEELPGVAGFFRTPGWKPA